MLDTELHDRARQAVIKFIGRSDDGWEFLEEDYDGWIVCQDPNDDTIHFVSVDEYRDSDEFVGSYGEFDHQAFERVAIHYLDEHGDEAGLCTRIAGHSAHLHIIGRDRAFLRIHRNASGGDACTEER